MIEIQDFDDAGGSPAAELMSHLRGVWKWPLLVTIAVCLIPALLMTAGLDLSSHGGTPAGNLDWSETAHRHLRGSFTHTILEWSAVCAAAFVGILCLARYGIRPEASLPILGVALACSGAMDVFHILAADRLFDVVAVNKSFVPLTWAICRLFNAVILVIGIMMIIIVRRLDPDRISKRETVLVAMACLGFVGVAYFVVHVLADSESLPQTIFPDSWIKRPYDVAAIVPYVVCGFVLMPLYVKRHVSLFALALWISLIPQIASQLYMVLGSAALHDSSFNVAHGLKAFAYLLPALGLVAESNHSLRAQVNLTGRLAKKSNNLELLQRVTASVNQSADLQEAAKSVLSIVCRELGWECGQIQFFDRLCDTAPTNRITYRHSAENEAGATERLLDRISNVDQVRETGRPIWIENGETSLGTGTITQPRTPNTIRTVATYPVSIDHQIRAALEVVALGSNPWKRDIHDLLEAIAIQLSSSIEREFSRRESDVDTAALSDRNETLRARTRDLEKANERTRAINRDLTSISGIHERLFQCRSEEEVAGVLTDAMVKHFDGYFSRVWLIRDADQCHTCKLAESCSENIACLHLLSSSGAYTHIDGPHARVPLGVFKIGLIAQGSGKTISHDVCNDQRVHDHDWARKHGLQSFVGIPLVSQGKTIGVMAMFSKEQLSDHVLVTLNLLASLGTAAIENVNHVQEALQANRAKSEFLANMSHELRTPMTAILGYMDIVLENASRPDDVEAGAVIRRNAEYLMDLINDILDLSKVEAGRLQVERIETSPATLLSEVASLMRVRAEAKNLWIRFSIDGQIPSTIQTDPTRLRQILVNLVGNAIKFTEVGGVDVVARMIRNPQLALQVDVIDTGIGMTPDELDRLYRPFTQGDASTNRKYGGTGLGLTICKRLAEALEGSISATSRKEVGTTFSVVLPIQHDMSRMISTLEIDETKQSTSLEQESAPVQLACRVLLAEDGRDNQRLISFLLTKRGASVVVVENGKEAVEAALDAQSQGKPFDVVLMDMQMPVMDGYSATRTLRQSGYDRPIIALTAHAMSADRQKCLDAGCDDYAAKPVNRHELLEMIAGYVVRAEEASTP